MALIVEHEKQLNAAMFRQLVFEITHEDLVDEKQSLEERLAYIEKTSWPFTDFTSLVAADMKSHRIGAISDKFSTQQVEAIGSARELFTSAFGEIKVTEQDQIKHRFVYLNEPDPSAPTPEKQNHTGHAELLTAVITQFQGKPILIVASEVLGQPKLAEFMDQMTLVMPRLADTKLMTQKFGSKLDQKLTHYVLNSQEMFSSTEPEVKLVWESPSVRLNTLNTFKSFIITELAIVIGVVFILCFIISNTKKTLRNSQEKQEFLAQHDLLTGLPNRSQFDKKLKSAIDNIERQPFTILAIDLDKFKDANVTFGRDAGDHVLKTVARRLSAIIDPRGHLARIGSDDFIAIIDGETNKERIEILGEQIIIAINEPIVYEHQEVNISASIGAAIAPLHGQAKNTILHAADSALFVAQEAGGGVVRIKGESAILTEFDSLELTAAFRS